MIKLNEQLIQEVVQEVLQRLEMLQSQTPLSTSPTLTSPGTTRTRRAKFGVFTDPVEACDAAYEAYLQLKEKGVAARRKVEQIVKQLCIANAEEWGRIELQETKIGRLEHKIEKLKIIHLVPGVDWLRPDGLSGDHGITLEEYAPYGVIGAVTPMTHSIPTIAGNIINMVAAGNAVVFNPHPNAVKCAVMAVRTFNEIIYREVGIENLICIIEEPTIESFKAIASHEAVRILCVTGGAGVVRAAMQSGKRAICAGPGNPPVLVDDTANIQRAARSIIQGGGYDNNLLCIGEKEVFVLENVADKLMAEMERLGAVRLNSKQIDVLTKEAFSFSPGDSGRQGEPVLNKQLVGKDAAVLGRIVGLNLPPQTPILFGETGPDHPFVYEEQMMPFIPIVRVKTVEEGIEQAKKAERGYKHSCMIHSNNVEHMTAMGRALDTTLFVKNGPCMAGLGLGGEGYLSYSIATTTGEGVTNPKTFTRIRRCVMVDNLRIY